MKPYLSFIIFILLLNTTSFTQTDPQISDIITEVNLDSLQKYVEELSGEVPVTINGQSASIHSRHKDHPGNNLAANYIEHKLESFGLTPESLNYSTSGRDVFAIQWGTAYPEQKYVICAHYDSMPIGPIAPGADDNASGVATVLEAARILSTYSSKYTIIYSFWDEEEQGLVGSLNWVFQVSNAGWLIPGAINIDMIGWDSDNDNKLWINVKDIGNSVILSDKAIEVNNLYQLGLDPQVLLPGSGSDNIPFWDFGYGAIGVEEFYGTDWNDHYHTTGDQLDKFNLPYFHNCAKMVIGTLASVVELNPTVNVILNTSIPEQIILFQNYPNPFNPLTTIRYGIKERSLVKITALNLLGEEVDVLLSEERDPGYYQVEFNASSLPSGVYFYKLQAGSYVETKKMILIK